MVDIPNLPLATVRSVGFTAALSQDLLVLAADATDCRKKSS